MEANEKTIRKYALKFLSYRARSVVEVRRRLTEREYPSELIEDTITWLLSLGYLNDMTFASDLAAARVSNRMWGKRKIAFDLSSRGVERDLIETALDAIPAGDEFNAAIRAASKWLSAKGHKAPLEKEARLGALRHLESRGFNADTSFKVIKELEGNHEI